jgi:hypothetical protein
VPAPLIDEQPPSTVRCRRGPPGASYHVTRTDVDPLRDTASRQAWPPRRGGCMFSRASRPVYTCVSSLPFDMAKTRSQLKHGFEPVALRCLAVDDPANGEGCKG